MVKVFLSYAHVDDGEPLDPSKSFTVAAQGKVLSSLQHHGDALIGYDIAAGSGGAAKP